MKKIDKRSKEWKSMTPEQKMEYNRSIESKGFGDTVAKFTEKTGIKKLVEKVFGEDCGCNERQELLNKYLPYKGDRLSCEEYDTLERIQPWNRSNMNGGDAGVVLNIYKKYINPKQEWTSCVPCWKRMVEGVHRLYIDYLDELSELKKQTE